MVNSTKKLFILCISAVLIFTQQSIAQDLTPKDIHQLTALEVLDLKQQQKLTTEQHISALLEVAKDSNFLMGLDANEVIAQAKFLDSAKVDKSSPLHGIPLVVSDTIDIQGVPTTLSLGSLINHVPEHSAAIINKLEANGAFVMAKTPNTPFGLEVVQDEVTKTAVAVATGIAPIGIGTDALGSARAAASLTGIISFKPSHNRYKTDGIATTSSTEVPAIFARSVKDIILVDSILTNQSPNYSSANLTDLKIGIAQDYFYYPLEQNTEKVTASFLTKFIVEGEIEMIETEVNQLSNLMPVIKETLIDYERRKGISDYLDNNALNLEDVLENLTSVIALDSLQNAESISQAKYESVKQFELETLRFEFNDYIERTEIEAFILPTTPRPAALIPVNEATTNPLYIPVSSEAYTKNTQPGSFAGLPSITLPIGLTDDGLPVGIMLEAAVGDDSRLLSIALAVEQLIGPITRPELP